ncbi:MAG: hypothetical protein QNJ98_02665 [Planctomycetota bacterium]|nr:hypothetical protein [Planctomycetota bacterium]
MPESPTHPDSQPVPPGGGEPEGEERSFPELRVGERRLTDYALQRLKASLPLQICMAVAFLCYGALVFLVVSNRINFESAGIVVLFSLASWFFLFWWYPVLERTQEALAGDPRRAWIPRALEIFAILCVVIVHALLLVIVVAQ